MAVTDYNAGIDSSEFVVSMVKEASWGVNPAGTFQAVRITGESLSETKTRNRPAEINPDGYAAAAVTTQVAAGGDINTAFSAQNPDMLFESLLNNEWVTVSESALTLTLASDVLTSSAGTPFANIESGNYIKIGGFSINPTNNGIFKVVTKDSDTQVTLVTGATIDETGGGDETVDAITIRNSTDVVSLTIQKQLNDAANLFLYYTGCFVSGGTIAASVGDFMNANFSLIAKDETKSLTKVDTSVTAAPGFEVMNSVDNLSNINLDDVAVAGLIQSVEIQVTKNSARSQYAIGSSAAQGMARGTLQVDGTFSMYFADFDMYDAYKNETKQAFSFRLTDAAGQSYVVSLPAISLMNPQIVAGGPDTDVLATFQLEGSQNIALGHTIQISRLP